MGGSWITGPGTTSELYDPVSETFAAGPPLISSRNFALSTPLLDGRVLITGGGAPSEVYDPVLDGYVATGSMSVARNGHFATRLADGRVLVTGGDGLSSAEVFDPTTDTFSAAGGMSTVRASHRSTLLPDGRVLVSGGYGAGGILDVLASTEIFDPTTDLFAAGPSMARARLQHSATRYSSTEVLIAGGSIGGSSSANATASSEIYDTTTGSFLPGPAMDMPRFAQSETRLNDGTILMVGGNTTASFTSAILFLPSTPLSACGALLVMCESRRQPITSALPDGSVLVAGGGFGGAANQVRGGAELFDPETQLFFAIAPLPTPRGAGATVTLPDGSVLTVGGSDEAGTFLDSALLFDPATHEFTELATAMSNARQAPAAVLIEGGTKVLISGSLKLEAAGQVTRTADVYDIATQQFAAVGDMGTKRHSHSATLLLDGTVLIAGGKSEAIFDVQSSAEIFDPTSGTFSPTAGAMNHRRQSHTASLLPDGRVLLVGGQSGPGAVNTVAEVYDPGTETFAELSSLPQPRNSHMAISLPDGRVVLAGGNGPGGVGLTAVAIFDAVDDTFTLIDSLTSARWQAGIELLDDRTVLVAGGFGPGQTPLDTAEIIEVPPAPGSICSAVLTMCSPRWAHTSTTLSDGPVLVAGGSISGSAAGSGPISGADLYDPTTELFTFAGDLFHGPRASHVATRLANGDVLVTGGGDSGAVYQDAELYDAGAEAFVDAGAQVSGRLFHAATRLLDGTVLLTGGAPGGNTAEIYDPATGTFTATVGNMTEARSIHTATLLPSGEVLIAGGGNFGTTSAEIYDPTAKTFRAVGDMSAARSSHSATLLPDGRVLIAGGGNAGSPSNDAEIYDPVAETFSALASVMSVPRAGHPAVALDDGRVVLVGGGGGSAASSVEIFNPADDSFASLPSLATPRWAHGASLLTDGSILVSGGRDGSPGTPLDTAELIASPPDTTPPGAPGTPDLVAASDTGASASDEVTSDSSPTLTGSAEADATVRLFDGAVEVGSATAVGGSWTVTTSVLSDGVHSLSATATDAAGNESPTSVALDVRVDTLAPVVTAPSPNALDVTTLDPNGVPATNVQVSAFLAGASALDAQDGALPVTHRSSFAIGLTLFTIDATDLAGNEGSAPATITVSLAAPGSVDVDPGAVIGPGVTIEPDATIEGGAVVGAGSFIGFNAKVEEGAQVGADSSIGAEAQIKKDAVVGDGVTIGARTVIEERAAVGDETSIGDDVKIDVDVMIGANVTIGDGAEIKEGAVVGDGAEIGAGVTVEEFTIVPPGAVL